MSVGVLLLQAGTGQPCHHKKEIRTITNANDFVISACYPCHHAYYTIVCYGAPSVLIHPGLH
jgi:hypothetical protein